jgi:aspartate aminotransferase
VKADPAARGIAKMSRELVGSRILEIAAEIRELKAKGTKLCDLTVGDFAPAQFPIPQPLLDGVLEALKGGQTNYPPSDGVPELRQAVQAFYEQRLGLKYPLDGILIASGARPVLCGAYSVLMNPGDTVVYPVPSWNNDAYTVMVQGRGIPVVTRRENQFMPTADELRPHLAGARLLVVNSPLNPAGTVIRREDLAQICQAVLDENKRRTAANQPPLYLLYDMIYWMLTFRGAEMVTPVELAPEMAAYTIFVDGISKAFAATGLRVGWAVGPTDVIARMKSYLGHVGAWAPRPEQVATAKLLRDGAAIDTFHQHMLAEVEARLGTLYEGLNTLAQEGFDVEVIPPQGAIYLSVRMNLFGAKRPDTGAVLHTNNDVRRYLLDAAGFAVVPFQAFGLDEETGWFRLSVGAVSRQDCTEIIPRLRSALSALGRGKKAANG